MLVCEVGLAIAGTTNHLLRHHASSTRRFEREPSRPRGWLAARTRVWVRCCGLPIVAAFERGSITVSVRSAVAAVLAAQSSPSWGGSRADLEGGQLRTLASTPPVCVGSSTAPSQSWRPSRAGRFLPNGAAEPLPLFGARFPAMQANVEVENRIYDAFDDVPFANCGHFCACEGEREPQTTSTCGAKAEAAVSFEPTTDPFFFDQADRRGPKHTLEEEVAYEEAAKLGETSLSFQSWLQARRVSDTGWPTVDQFPE